MNDTNCRIFFMRLILLSIQRKNKGVFLNYSNDPADYAVMTSFGKNTVTVVLLALLVVSVGCTASSSGTKSGSGKSPFSMFQSDDKKASPKKEKKVEKTGPLTMGEFIAGERPGW